MVCFSSAQFNQNRVSSPKWPEPLIVCRESETGVIRETCLPSPRKPACWTIQTKTRLPFAPELGEPG
jgi:hypothetical protein